MNRPAKPDQNAFSAEDYPALREFLRGYFHQDMKDEYGSPEKATRQFCADASPEEREAVAREWAQLLSRAPQTGRQAIDELNRALTGPLGSSYALSAEDIERVSAVLAEFSSAKAPNFSPRPTRRLM
jgi:hypothetical protein